MKPANTSQDVVNAVSTLFGHPDGTDDADRRQAEQMLRTWRETIPQPPGEKAVAYNCMTHLNG